MSEHRAVFTPAARSSLLRRRRWVTGAIAALGASGLIFGGLARAASPSDPVGRVRLDVWADVHGSWVGDDLSVSGAAGWAYGEGQTVPFRLDLTAAGGAEIRSGADATVDVDATADLNPEHNPDGDPPPSPDPDPGPTPPPILDPDPTLLPDPSTVPDPGPVVTPDPDEVLPPGLDPPIAPGTDPGERCASSRTTPRCGDDHDPAGDPTAETGDPDTGGSTTGVDSAAIDAGGENDRGPAPLAQILGHDVEQTAPASAESPVGAGTPTPAGAALPKTGGSPSTGALRVLGLAAIGRALLSRTGRRRTARS